MSRPYFYQPSDVARRFLEGKKRRERTEFERDLGRLKHSFSLRRLAGVTQVFQSDGRRTVRNRYSHSVEVADIGAALARLLGPDPHVVEAAALAHDLGHPPFGHHGESVLNVIANDIGLDGFEGNAQTLSMLSRIEPKTMVGDQPYGINPTRAFADAVVKYPWRQHERPGPKYGVYARDLNYFRWIRGERIRNCVEAQLMDWADDVAYSTHDFEDGILAGFIQIENLKSSSEMYALCAVAQQHSQVSAVQARAAYERILDLPSLQQLAEIGDIGRSRSARVLIKTLTGELTDRFVAEAVAATTQRYGGQAIGRYDGTLIVPVDVRAEAEVLKAMTWRYVIDSQQFVEQRAGEVEILHDVTRQLLAASGVVPGTGVSSGRVDVVANADSDSLFALLWSESRSPRLDESERARAVIDALAALTDQGVITLAERLRA
ncbi:MAG: dNTP triphosphohydrolase [Corynebacteriales bacterium]|nr:dNTP triphosphohydrolase [Mycobacteriales bacterium]